jgi:lipopolysaccharide export system permease protein
LQRKPVRVTTLDRYVVREFLGPFFLCIAAFTLMLISQLLFEMSDLIFIKRVPVGEVAKMVFYKLPHLFVMSFPVAALYGCLASLGRLVKDNEITVVRSFGVRFTRFIIPVLVLGLLVAGLTYQTNERVVPWANQKFQTMWRQVVLKEDVPRVQQNLFFKGQDSQFFYIRRVDPNRQSFQDILIYQLPRTGFPSIISAREGRYEENVWTLIDGVSTELDRGGLVVSERKFTELEIVTAEPADLYLSGYKTSDEMSRKELAEHITRFQKSGLQVRSFVVDYHMKLSLPLSSFLFVFMAAPLSLFSARGGKAFGVVASVAMAFVYYILSAVSRSLGANEFLPELMAAWLPNCVFAACGLALLLWAERR